MVVNSLEGNLLSFICFNVQCWESKTSVRLYHQLSCDRLNYSLISSTVFLANTFISSGLSQQSDLLCPHYCLHTEKMILSQKAYSLGI